MSYMLRGAQGTSKVPWCMFGQNIPVRNSATDVKKGRNCCCEEESRIEKSQDTDGRVEASLKRPCM